MCALHDITIKRQQEEKRHQGEKTRTSSQWQQFVLQNISSVCAFVHQVQLGDHSDGPQTYSRTKDATSQPLWQT